MPVILLYCTEKKAENHRTIEYFMNGIRFSFYFFFVNRTHQSVRTQSHKKPHRILKFEYNHCDEQPKGEKLVQEGVIDTVLVWNDNGIQITIVGSFISFFSRSRCNKNCFNTISMFQRADSPSSLTFVLSSHWATFLVADVMILTWF